YIPQLRGIYFTQVYTSTK
ncbi:uvrD/REP helicase N-terminal domain protein, partial [Chlamydia psittaci 06-1683]